MAAAFDKAASGADTITIPAGGIAQGNLVVVLTCASGTTSTLTSVTDTRGNTYTVSGTLRTMTGGSGGLSKYAYCSLTTALQAGDVITCTWSPGGTVVASGMTSYSGIPSAVLDQSAYNEQTSFPETTTVTTGASGTTTAADEVVVGLFGNVEAGGTDITWTNTTNFTSRVDANSAANLVNIYIEDRIATATGTFTSSPTPSNDVYFTGQLLTFKAGSNPATQVLLPSADSVDGAWTTDTGGTSLFAAIDETTASDTDYIQSEALSAGSSACRVKLAAGLDPNSSSNHVIKWRIGKDTSGGATMGMTVKLYQGGGNSLGAGTLIASFTRSNVSTTITEYTETLSGGEADSITNYADLYLEFSTTAT